VRDRVEADLADLERLAQIVHQADGYPIYLPTDLRGFLVSLDAHRTWVAVHDGDLIGHIALNASCWGRYADRIDSTDCWPSRLATNRSCMSPFDFGCPTIRDTIRGRIRSDRDS
jgi:hypothetical protein